MPPATEPDRATLLQFVLGTLPDEQLTAVKQWLDADPRAAEKLAELQTRDPVTEVLDTRALAETSDAQLAKTLPQAVPPVVPAALPEFVGGYQIVRELGRGGMGVVYEARDPNLPRRVAVKVIADDAGDAARTADARARFRKEAGLIDHPNVVPVYAFGEDAGRPFLVMPLLAGETLAERLKRGPLSAAELVRVGREVATALEAAHAAGVVHRDIKPGNVWLDAGTGRARVLDFGLAKSQEAPAHTETGAIVGSAHYMSPQQAKGEALDARTDLFSLGALLYHAATGRRPFDGETVYAVLRAVVEVTPADPAGVPPRVAKLIRKLLEKEPAARPASASEVLLELADPVPAPPVPPKRRFPVWALAAGLLLALAAGAIVYEVKFGNGTLVVDATPDADVRLKNGTIEVYGEDGKLKYTIAPGARAANVSAGTYKLKVMGADGVELDTEEFTMKRNGKAIVRVSAKPDAPPVVSKDADRRAAEWVLSVGGQVLVWNGAEHRWIDTVAALPRDPFALHAVSFGKHVTHVTDEDLTAFNGCERLRQLDLRDTRATDAGLLHFARCKGLQLLYLKGKGITDKGLAQLPDQPELTQLGLAGTGVTDAGVARFAKCKHLQEVSLPDTAVTDAGLAHLRTSFELHTLRVERTRVTDAGLAHLSECRDLQWLAVAGTKITGAGLRPLAGCNFERLDFTDTQFDDTGFAHLANSKRLQNLLLEKTQVTAAGVAAFAKARPNCRIVWDGGTIAPASAEPRVEALLPPKTRLLFEEKFRNVKDGNLVGQGLWTGEYVRVKNGMIDLQEPPPKDDPITRKLAHFLYARRQVEGAPDAVEFIVGFEALAYSISDKSKFKAHNTTIIARRRSDVYIGWSQETSGKQPEWIFDARKRDADYGKVAPHDSPNCVIVPGGHDRWVALTIHFDLKAKEVYGSYDFGDGVKRTKRISVKDRNIDTLEVVEILTDFRVNRRGMLIKSISAWAVEK